VAPLPISPALADEWRDDESPVVAAAITAETPSRSFRTTLRPARAIGLLAIVAIVAAVGFVIVANDKSGGNIGFSPSPVATAEISQGSTPGQAEPPQPTPVSLPSASPSAVTTPMIVGPSIASVSGITAAATQTIRIDGSGFGQLASYTGSTSFIELADLTGSWNAGWHEPGSPYSDTITLSVVSWNDTEIVLGGLAGAYGEVFDTGGVHYDFNLHPGDQVRVRVWNAQTSSGPAVFLAAVSGF
jgi:hypothetical protein